jgi:hypothetical protein
MVDAIIRRELQRRLDAISAGVAPRARAISMQSPSTGALTKAIVQAPPNAKVGAGQGHRNRAWTREAIVNELAAWLASGTSIDAAFVARYGPPGLVTATRKIFGRFDAALNVASLQVAKLYPDGPPSRRSA